MTTMPLHGVSGLVEVARFEPDGKSFGAENRAEDWLRDHGFAAGSMQRDAPRAILPTHLYGGIGRWDGLDAAERRQCWGLWIVDGGAQVLYLRPTVLALSARERDQRLAAAIREGLGS